MKLGLIPSTRSVTFFRKTVNQPGGHAIFQEPRAPAPLTTGAPHMGRVPLFFYLLLHLPVIHVLAILMGWMRFGRLDFLLNTPPSLGGNAGWIPAGL